MNACQFLYSLALSFTLFALLIMLALTEQEMEEYLGTIRSPKYDPCWVVDSGNDYHDTSIINSQGYTFSVGVELDDADWMLPYAHKVNGVVTVRSSDEHGARQQHDTLKTVVKEHGAGWKKHFFKSSFWTDSSES